MNNYEFLKDYFSLLHTLLFQQLIDLEYALLTYSEHDTAVFLNIALIKQLLNSKELKQIEESYTKLNRQPAIYFENTNEHMTLKKELEENNYGKSFEDSWMFYKEKTVNQNLFDQVKKVSNNEELSIFQDTFNRCYRKDDPQNPYGELSEYIKIVKKAWNKHSKDNGIDCFIVYSENKPVAVSTLNSYKNLGYISNIGSLQEVRGKGFGKLATLYAVWKSIEKGNQITCLATEEGTYPNEFYKRIGFETKFTAICYVKESEV